MIQKPVLGISAGPNQEARSEALILVGCGSLCCRFHVGNADDPPYFRKGKPKYQKIFRSAGINYFFIIPSPFFDFQGQGAGICQESIEDFDDPPYFRKGKPKNQNVPLH